MSVVNEVYNKAEEVLFTDKIKSPNKISDLLSSEIYYVLKQYFEISKDSFMSRIFTQKNGELNISFSFRANRVLIKRGVAVK